MRSEEVLSWEDLVVAILLVTVSVLIFTTLHFAERAMHPIERTMSEYALTPTGKWLFPIAVFAMGAGALLIARTHWAETGAVFLVLFGVAMIVSGVFRADPMDPRLGDFRPTPVGIMHSTAGLVAMICISLAARKISPAGAGWLPLGGTCIFVFTVAARKPIQNLTGYVSVHGLGQRIGFASYTVWLVLAEML